MKGPAESGTEVSAAAEVEAEQCETSQAVESEEELRGELEGEREKWVQEQVDLK